MKSKIAAPINRFSLVVIALVCTATSGKDTNGFFAGGNPHYCHIAGLYDGNRIEKINAAEEIYYPKIAGFGFNGEVGYKIGKIKQSIYWGLALDNEMEHRNDSSIYRHNGVNGDAIIGSFGYSFAYQIVHLPFLSIYPNVGISFESVSAAYYNGRSFGSPAASRGLGLTAGCELPFSIFGHIYIGPQFRYTYMLNDKFTFDDGSDDRYINTKYSENTHMFFIGIALGYKKFSK